MRLCDITFTELKVGDILISVLGTYGRIIKLIPQSMASQREDNEILIEWSNGSISCIWHFQGDNVKYDKLATLVLQYSK